MFQPIFHCDSKKLVEKLSNLVAAKFEIDKKCFVAQIDLSYPIESIWRFAIFFDRDKASSRGALIDDNMIENMTLFCSGVYAGWKLPKHL